MKFSKAAAGIVAAVIAAGAMAITACAESAGITFQTVSYQFRDTLAQSKALVWDNEIGDAVAVEGVSFTDAQITGDGSYSVTLDGITDSAWNMIKLDTTIDAEAYPDATITIDKVTVDGAEVPFDAEISPLTTYEGKAGGYDDTDLLFPATAYKVQLINIYDSVEAIANAGIASLKVDFTVSGMGGAEEEAAPADEIELIAEAPVADTTAETTTATKDSPDTGVEGIAVVAGLAVLAIAGIAVSRKSK